MPTLYRLNETLEKLELRCDELTKQYDDLRLALEQERRKNEKAHESNSPLETSKFSPVALKESTTIKRHLGSASEPENEEVMSIILNNKNYLKNLIFMVII